MTIERHVVVWDPRLEDEGGYGQGSLVDERESRVLMSLGACVLPVDASLFDFSGVGGFAFRRWGTGWPLDLVPRRVCPVTLYCPGRHGVIHWAARFISSSHEHTGREGEVRLIGDTSQHNPIQPPLAADDSKVMMSELRFDDARGALGGGKIRITPTGHAHGNHYPFALWGRGPGLLVQWLAVTWSGQ